MEKINIYFNKYVYVLIAILFSIQGYFYINHISNDFKLLNEYRYIDEITLLNGKEVLNSDYINEELLFNPNEKKKYTSSNNVYFYGTKEQYNNFTNIPKSVFLTKEQLNSYYGLIKNKFIFSFPDISYSNDKNYLLNDYLRDNNNINNNKIEDYFSNYPMFQADTLEKLEEIVHFIKNNIYEQNIQILDRYYFHENSFMLSPINEINLNRDKKEIFSQYGFLNIYAVNYIMNIYGGFSINNYEKAKKTIDFIYYIISIIVILVLFKDNYLRTGFVLFLGITFFGVGYYYFSYAPTLIKSRHFLDLSIILLLYLYNKTTYYKNFYLIGAIVLSIISILFAKEFGLFIFLATLGVLIIPSVKEYFEFKKINKFNILFFCITLLGGYLSLTYYPMMENPTTKYFLDGFYNFPYSNYFIYFVVLLIVFLQWFGLIILYDRLVKTEYLYVYIFAILYAQFLFTYFIWHGSYFAILKYLYLFVIPVIIIYNLFHFKYKVYLSAIFILIISFVYFKTLNAFIIGKNNYDQVFKTHKLYKWENERAGGIIATYSFDNFQNSIDLIKKHSVSNEIYMISKYDNILGILSEKHSGFPFFELRSTIVTKNEYESIKKQILNESDLLFVDNDIERDFLAEMKKMSFFDLELYWRDESFKQRIPKLEVLKKLFSEVKNSYELVEEGKLISVYRKKQNVELNAK